MNTAMKEVAATIVAGRRRNIAIWVILILIVIGYTGWGNQLFGIGMGPYGYGNYGRRRRRAAAVTTAPGITTGFLGNNFLGSNFFFILAIFAVLFLVSDGGSNTNIINVDTEDTAEV